MRRQGSRTHLVLVGGGHTHVQVLRRLAMHPVPSLDTTVVLDIPVAVYSGMVPGFVAGDYEAAELEIDVVPLARRAGARLVLAPATGLDPEAKRIAIEGRPPISYDLASFDIGSTVAHLDLPGVRENALPTRPIGRFVARMNEIVARARELPELRVVVVGGGAGGVELAFTLEHRLRPLTESSVTVVHAGPRILEGYPEGLARRVSRWAERRGIAIRCASRVTSATSTSVDLTDGTSLPCDLLVWVTGAVSHDLFRSSGLAVDRRGFAFTRDTLELRDHDDVFAVGDCGTLESSPDTPKAGVYAVRQGPVLAENIARRLEGRTLARYRPQRDFLTLLNLGGGVALGAKWGLSFEGRWVLRWKDRIDRDFMELFQVLGPEGAPTPEWPPMESAGEEPMLCGGCGAKVGRSALRSALGRLPEVADPDVVLGLGEWDDVAAVRLGEHLVTASVDGFRAFVDDPWLVGRVAAINAASDLFATGTTPRHALAFVAIPEELDEQGRAEMLFQVMAGVRRALDEEGITLVGGHTTTAPELLVALTVLGSGASGAELLTLDRLTPGQELVLTKPLGTGALLQAHMRGLARGPWLTACFESMLRSNAPAVVAARRHGATAATDVTGFGLAGHLATMARASAVSAEIDLDRLPALPGAVACLARGVTSTFHRENERDLADLAVGPGAHEHPHRPLVFDPQTSGGLLVAVPPGSGSALVGELGQQGLRAAVVGRVLPRREDGVAVVIRAPDGHTNRAPQSAPESTGERA